MVLLLTAFRLAWPAFAYSIDDEGEAKRTYAYVLTYLVALTTWVATGLALLRRRSSTGSLRLRSPSRSRVVGPLAFSTVAFAAYIVVAIGVGRAKRTQFNWVVTGAAAAVNIALNLLLIPSYGMMGAASATVAAYSTMFVGMVWWSQRIYPVPYQWRRVVTAACRGSRAGGNRKADGRRTCGRASARARLPARSPPTRLLPSRRAQGDWSPPADGGGGLERGDRTHGRVDVLGHLHDARAEARVPRRIRRDARDDPPRRKTGDDLGRIAARDLEADEAGSRPGDCGVRSRIPRISASFAFRREASPRIRASTRSRPIL